MVTEVAVQFGALCPVEQSLTDDAATVVPDGVEISLSAL
jgi:hypothetical protein